MKLPPLKQVPMELQSLPKMRKEILRCMAARIKMKLMRDSRRDQLLVQFAGAHRKTVLVILPAVEINCHGLQSCTMLSCQHKWIVLVPMSNVNRVPEHSAEKIGQRPGMLQVLIHLFRRLDNQRRALCAHRSEQFGMREGEEERAVSCGLESRGTSIRSVA